MALISSMRRFGNKGIFRKIERATQNTYFTEEKKQEEPEGKTHKEAHENLRPLSSGARDVL